MKRMILFFALFVNFSALAENFEVKMVNSGTDGAMSFDPGFIKVNVGDTVTFIATDASHNSISVLVPDGAKTWAGTLSQPITVEMKAEGVYIYKCDPHFPMAMVGVVQVGKATNLEAAISEAGKLSSTFLMNKDRLAKYLAQVQ